jgi:hypothetical protein
MKKYGGGGSQEASPMNRKRPVGAMDACETNNSGFVESSSDSDNDGDDEDMDDVWDFIDNEEGKVGRRKRQNSTEETAPPLTPDIKVDLREALSRGIAEQQVSQETKKAEKVQEYWDEILETEMALRLK